MGKLANISGKEAAKAFEKAGWHAIGQVGSQFGFGQAKCSNQPFYSATQGTVDWDIESLDSPIRTNRRRISATSVNPK